MSGRSADRLLATLNEDRRADAKPRLHKARQTQPGPKQAHDRSAHRPRRQRPFAIGGGYARSRAGLQTPAEPRIALADMANDLAPQRQWLGKQQGLARQF